MIRNERPAFESDMKSAIGGYHSDNTYAATIHVVCGDFLFHLELSFAHSTPTYAATGLCFFGLTVLLGRYLAISRAFLQAMQ